MKKRGLQLRSHKRSYDPPETLLVLQRETGFQFMRPRFTSSNRGDEDCCHSFRGHIIHQAQEQGGEGAYPRMPVHAQPVRMS